MLNNKGFTTIELIVAIAIAGIIMGTVGTFLVFNLRNFNVTTDIIDVQYEGQMVMNQLSDLIKESNGIVSITGSTTAGSTVENKLDAAYKVIPDVITFNHTSWNSVESREENTEFVLTFDKANKKITNKTTYYGTSPIEYDMGQYVEAFTLEPVGSDFEGADNIIIRMTLVENSGKVQLETQVKIRNKH